MAVPVKVGDSEVGLALALDVGILVDGCVEGLAVGATYNKSKTQIHALHTSTPK